MEGPLVTIFAILVIVGGAVAYIVKAKMSGQRCIGYPDSKSCSGNCSCCGGCSVASDNEEEK